MNIKIKYIRHLGVLLLMALMVFSCTEFKEYTSETFGPGPTISLELVSVGDSMITVSVNSSAAGYASVALYAGTGNEVPEDPEDLITGNITYLDFQSKASGANQATVFVFSTDIAQDSEYELMAAANNADGKVSEVSVLEVATADTHSPELVSADPTPSNEAVYVPGDPITLYFDEPVVYDDTKDFMFSTYFTGVLEAAGEVSVSGNAVTVTPASEFAQGDYVFLSWDAGTVTDPTGNLCDTVQSGVSGGSLVGVFTRAIRPPRAEVSVAPATDSIASASDIVITFDDGVAPDAALTRDMIILEYYEWDAAAEDYIFDHSATVDPATLVFDGATVTIPAIETHPAYDWIVALTVAEAAFDIGVYVPNAEITADWWYY